MHAERKKYLKNWLTAALCLEIFPTASVDEVRKLSTVVLDALDAVQRRDDSTGVSVYQAAMFEPAVRQALAHSHVFQNVPPQWLEATMTRILDFGPLLYVQDTLYWMAGLERTVRLHSLKLPQFEDTAERIAHAVARTKQHGITAVELEQLKLQVHNEWATLGLR